jgi:hypothetical protein
MGSWRRALDANTTRIVRLLATLIEALEEVRILKQTRPGAYRGYKPDCLVQQMAGRLRSWSPCNRRDQRYDMWSPDIQPMDNRFNTRPRGLPGAECFLILDRAFIRISDVRPAE